MGIDSGNGFLKASSDKGLSAKASSYIYAPKAETENNIVDKEGCSVLYSPGVRVDLKGKLEIAQLDKGKVDAEIQSSYQNAVSNLRSNSNSRQRAKAANRNQQKIKDEIIQCLQSFVREKELRKSLQDYELKKRNMI